MRRAAQQPDQQGQAEHQAEARRDRREGLAGRVLALPRPAVQRTTRAAMPTSRRDAHPFVDRIGQRHREVEAAVGEEHGVPERADRLARPGEGLADQLVEQEQPEQQRHVAEGLDVPFADLGEQPVVRQPADADQGAEDGRHEDAEDRHLQRVQHADVDRAGIGAGRRVGDHGVADLEARLALEVVEAAGDLLALQILDGVGDEVPGEQADQADHDDLEDPAADDRVVPRRHFRARRGAQCLDCHPLFPLLTAVRPRPPVGRYCRQCKREFGTCNRP